MRYIFEKESIEKQIEKKEQELRVLKQRLENVKEKIAKETKCK